MPAGMFRTALILGSICVTGPFAIDMYLPALPAIEEALDVSVSAAQITLSGLPVPGNHMSGWGFCMGLTHGLTTRYW